jgi:hypothetical protein
MDPNTATDVRELSTAAIVRRWVVRSSVAALLLSLLIHVVMLIVAAILTMSRGGPGRPAETPGVIEFAVLPESQLDAVQSSELSVQPPSAEQLVDTALDLQATAELTLEPLELTARPETSLSIELGSGGEDLAIDGAGGGTTGSAGASFFGIEARGNRFAYVVDVSGSMSAEDRMPTMIDELSSSITQLLDHVSFYVVFFSDDAAPIGNRREWTDANGVGKRWARQYITRQQPLGSTNPLPAFRLISQIRPRPDAIYFMTDGQFNDPATAGQIIALNRESPSPIHCITFVTRDGEADMKRIAEATGGTYTHIPGKGRP